MQSFRSKAIEITCHLFKDINAEGVPPKMFPEKHVDEHVARSRKNGVAETIFIKDEEGQQDVDIVEMKKVQARNRVVNRDRNVLNPIVSYEKQNFKNDVPKVQSMIRKTTAGNEKNCSRANVIEALLNPVINDNKMVRTDESRALDGGENAKIVKNMSMKRNRSRKLTTVLVTFKTKKGTETSVVKEHEGDHLDITVNNPVINMLPVDGDVPTSVSVRVSSRMDADAMLKISSCDRDKKPWKLLNRAVNMLGKYELVRYHAYDEAQLTGYVVFENYDNGEEDWGAMLARICGVPVVSSKWIADSMSQGRWLDMNAYLSDIYGDPKDSVGLRNMLDGEHIVVHCTGWYSLIIRRIIELCGGKVVESGNFILNDTNDEIGDRIPNVGLSWLLESMQNNAMQPVHDYLFECL